MKVLDLVCANDHAFEGWFASDGEFTGQVAGGLLACPLCNDSAIVRLPSAPRLNVSRQRGVSPAPATADHARAQLQARWLNGVREMMKNTEDVGAKFPEEARRIHYGEAEQRGIRGQASAADAVALREEGIEVMAVSVPEPLKNTVQ